jgi:hypothetical protein
MLKAHFAIAANRAIIDSTTGQLSIIDVFEGIAAQSFPVILPKATFVFHFTKAPTDASVHDVVFRCRIDDLETFRVPVTINFDQGNAARSIIAIDGFVIQRAGTLNVALLANETAVSSLELQIVQTEIPQPTLAAAASSPAEPQPAV